MEHDTLKLPSNFLQTEPLSNHRELVTQQATAGDSRFCKVFLMQTRKIALTLLKILQDHNSRGYCDVHSGQSRDFEEFEEKISFFVCLQLKRLHASLFMSF
jgi:hypothetical protein